MEAIDCVAKYEEGLIAWQILKRREDYTMGLWKKETSSKTEICKVGKTLWIINPKDNGIAKFRNNLIKNKWNSGKFYSER